MTGIAGLLDPASNTPGSSLGPLASALQFSPRAQVETWHDAHAGLARVRVGVDNPAPQPRFSADGRHALVLFGECFGYEREQAALEREGEAFRHAHDDAGYILALYRREGERAFARLSGSFCLALYDTRERELLLVSDRLGSRPLFHVDLPGGGLAFATLVGPLLRLPGVASTLDLAGALEYCALQRVWGTRTLHEAVRMLPPASVLRHREGRTSLTTYWEPRYRPEPGSLTDYARELAHTLRRAMAEVCRGQARVALLLSGGLDARIAVAASQAPLRCVSFGDYDNPEVGIARRIAAARDLDFDFQQRHPDHYLRLLEQAVEIGSGMHTFNHAHAVGFLDRLGAEVDVVTHGYASEVFFRGRTLPKAQRRLAGIDLGKRVDPTLSHGNLGERLLSRSFSLLDRGMPSLLGAQARGLLTEVLAERRDQLLRQACAAAQDVRDQFLWLDVRHHARLPSMLFELSLRPYMTERSFVLHNEVLDLHLRIPCALRCDDRLWLRAIEELHPGIARIADANDGLSPRLPRALAGLMRAAEGGAQRLPALWRLSRAGSPAARAPHGTSPTSWPRYDWLIRHHPGLREAVTETLRDPAALPPGLFDLSAVGALLDEHLAGRGHHRQVLFTLLTFGRWHRRHVAGAEPREDSRRAA